MAEAATTETEMTPDGIFRRVREANEAGEHFRAIRLAEEGEGRFAPEDLVAVWQQKARALAAIGSTAEALRTLERIPLGREEDPETLGLLGRICKDLAEAGEEGRLEEALRCYRKGFERARELGDRAGAEYCGINAAAMAVLAGDFPLAESLASETLELTGEDGGYYTLATRAEAALILRREEEAGTWYRQAAEVAAKERRWGDLASTRKQCRALCVELYGRGEELADCFPEGAVGIFSGHLIDAPGREKPRFPAEAEALAGKRIEGWLRENGVRIVFSAAANGGDLIFLETAAAMGVERHVVLPFAAEDFIRTSVEAGGREWVERFERALAGAAGVTVLNEEVADDRSGVYDFTNRMIAANAALRARALGFDLAALVLWDGETGGMGGGTGDAAFRWSGANVRTHAIHPTEPERDGPVTKEAATRVEPFERTRAALPDGYRTQVGAVLHLHFAEYGGLRENEYFSFRERVLGRLAEVLAVTRHAPASRYGFGADYGFAFDSVRGAGLFALEVLKVLEGEERPRLCLHAGPLQLMVNPVLNQYSYEGTTLVRAGRVARELAAGVPYGTEVYAALAALESIREFGFVYAGVTGGERLFRLQPK